MYFLGKDLRMPFPLAKYIGAGGTLIEDLFKINVDA